MQVEYSEGDGLKQKLRKQIDVIDGCIKLQDSLYKRVAGKIGISQVALYILAFLYRAEEPCTQNDFMEQWMHPKQTISFTVTKLADQGLVEMSPLAGSKNKKTITLTTEGMAFCEKQIVPVLSAEESAFSALTIEERNTFVFIATKYAALLEEKMNQFM